MVYSCVLSVFMRKILQPAEISVIAVFSRMFCIVFLYFEHTFKQNIGLDFLMYHLGNMYHRKKYVLVKIRSLFAPKNMSKKKCYTIILMHYI